MNNNVQLLNYMKLPSLKKEFSYLKRTIDFHDKGFLKKGLNFQRKYPNENVIRFVKSKFKKKSFFLDLGCGNGRHIKFLIKEKHKVDGLDFSKQAIKILKKNKIKSKIFLTDLNSFKNPKKKYDGIIDCFTSYTLKRHHFEQYIIQMSKLLKKNGYFHLQTLSSRSNLFINYKPSKKISTYSLNRISRKDSPFPKDNYLFTFYSKNYLTNFFNKLNFKNINIEQHSRTYNNSKEYLEYFVVEAKK